MSLNPLAAITITRLLKHLPQAPRVIEFGSQTLRAKSAFNWIARETGIKQSLLDKLTSTEDLYKILGFSAYDSIDMDDRCTIKQDLNFIIPHDLGEFDLVTNNGTGEHVFNQYTVFSTAHRLCKQLGVIMHIQPFYGWINHGFYCLHPKFFQDLANANSYEIKFLEIANRDGTSCILPSGTKNAPQYIDCIKNLQKGDDLEPVYVVAALIKRNDDYFHIPYDSRYF